MMKWDVFRRRRGISTEHTLNVWLKARQVTTSTDMVALCLSIDVEPPTPSVLSDMFNVKTGCVIVDAGHNAYVVNHVEHVDVQHERGFETPQDEGSVVQHDPQNYITAVDRPERKPRKTKNTSHIVDPQDH